MSSKSLIVNLLLIAEQPQQVSLIQKWTKNPDHFQDHNHTMEMDFLTHPYISINGENFKTLIWSSRRIGNFGWGNTRIKQSFLKRIDTYVYLYDPKLLSVDAFMGHYR